MKTKRIGCFGLNNDILFTLKECLTSEFSVNIDIVLITTLTRELRNKTFDCILLGDAIFSNDDLELVTVLKKLVALSFQVIVIFDQDDDKKYLASYKNGASDCLSLSELKTASFQEALLSAMEKTELTTRKRKKDDTVKKMAFHDSLTGLSNRNAFDKHLSQSIIRAKRKGASFILAILDLDDFKPVNDKYGHQAGDLLLKKVSKIFTNSVRQSDFLARIGGDEFACIFYDIQNPEEVIPICENLFSVFRKPFMLFKNKAQLKLSIGLAFYSSEVKSPNELFKRADYALYDAKNSGKNTYKFYSEELNFLIDTNKILISEMQRQMKSSEFDSNTIAFKGSTGTIEVHNMSFNNVNPFDHDKILSMCSESRLVADYTKGFIHFLSSKEKNKQNTMLLEFPIDLINDKKMQDILMNSNVDGFVLDAKHLEHNSLVSCIESFSSNKLIYLKNYFEGGFPISLVFRCHLSGIILNTVEFLNTYPDNYKPVLEVINSLVKSVNLNILFLGNNNFFRDIDISIGKFKEKYYFNDLIDDL